MLPRYLCDPLGPSGPSKSPPPVRVLGVTWLLCDYGEVLCLPPTDDDRSTLAAEARWDPQNGDFWEAYWVDRVAYDRADLTAEAYWERLLGHAPPPEQLGRLIQADAMGWLHPNQLTLAAAERAAKRGLRLAILSNAPLEVAAEIDAAPWLASFSPRFFSCYLHAVKPERAAYDAVLKALGARPEEVVFFDDRPANVAGAAELGIDARLFDDAGQIDLVRAPE
jgi:putative hydrolase of the HAD superfamily